jgi:hypothetical protein
LVVKLSPALPVKVFAPEPEIVGNPMYELLKPIETLPDGLETGIALSP